jgi:CubicO group peptidase (beta-lactamase class C family)
VLDPYAGFTAEKLYESLTEIDITREIGSRYEYSNLGAGLLGHALALRAGKSYEELILAKICAPLGMKDTAVTLTADLRKRLATGHLPSRKRAKNWELASLVAAGALKSTANDLLRFAAACLTREDTPLSRAMASARARHRSFAKGKPSLGLGWHLAPLEPNGRVLTHHGGATGGYTSFVGLVDEPKVAVVVLGNSVESVDPLAVRILRALATR